MDKSAWSVQCVREGGKEPTSKRGSCTPPSGKSWRCISRSIDADAVAVDLFPQKHDTYQETFKVIMFDDEIVAGAPGATSIDARGSEVKPKYRSWRKKYRKMKTHFDDVMKESNSLFVDEQKLDALSKRLQEQNE